MSGADLQRQAAWEAACTLVAATNVGPDRAYLAVMADRAAYAINESWLDREELLLMGRRTTRGAFARRLQCWRFVGYRLAGITPGDLRDVQA